MSQGVSVVGDDLDNIFYGDEPDEPALPRKKVPTGDVYEASRAGDVERLKLLLNEGANVNARDAWDSAALYYACLAGHLDAARILLENGAICSENTFDGDRCHYAALNLHVRKLLKAFEARPPPLDPLPRSFRELFIIFDANSRYIEGNPAAPYESLSINEFGLKQRVKSGVSASFEPAMMVNTYTGTEDVLGPDIILFLAGRPVGAHRAILAARSPFFRRQFETGWKGRREVRLANPKLKFAALFSLLHFFYTDRLDVAVDDMEDLVRICKVCGCDGLRRALESEIVHQKYADYKSLKGVEDSQKRFILQASSLPEGEQLPAAMQALLALALENSTDEAQLDGNQRLEHAFDACSISQKDNYKEDFADVCLHVGGKRYRCHTVILGARSEYFKARFSKRNGFQEGLQETTLLQKGKGLSLPLLREHDLSAGAFEKVLEYIYTDTVKEVDPNQAEEIFDAASRYLLFPLKRAVTDALLPHLETASPSELCHWLLLADMYGAWKLREYCLDAMAVNFEIFAATPEFRRMLQSLPPPSGDFTERTTAPSAPGEVGKDTNENLLDDLREKWLAEEGAELDERDESARRFDHRLELLVAAAENDEFDNSETG
ncbi:unnamed protein product [Sphagnum troendelagicum]|uniref:BTB domain-containing protein n=1 Tax=Sphagnum troendelagicum TaxID=128251 RepID=A0ABP0UPH8_9BRYO